MDQSSRRERPLALENVEEVVFLDLDNTLCGDDVAPEEFIKFWTSYAARRSAMLVYNTGRDQHQVNGWVQEGWLPKPSPFAINNDGANVYFDGQLWVPWAALLRTRQYTLAWVSYVEDLLLNMDVGNCKLRADRCDFNLRWWVSGAGFEECIAHYCRVCDALPKMHGAFYHAYTKHELLHDPLEECNSGKDWWKDRGIQASMKPAVAELHGKGVASTFLYEFLQDEFPTLKRALWAGDGLNDMSMITCTTFDGILVANADRELKDAAAREKGTRRIYEAKQTFAQGVIEGLVWHEQQNRT